MTGKKRDNTWQSVDMPLIWLIYIVRISQRTGFHQAELRIVPSSWGLPLLHMYSLSPPPSSRHTTFKPGISSNISVSIGIYDVMYQPVKSNISMGIPIFRRVARKFAVRGHNDGRVRFPLQCFEVRKRTLLVNAVE